MFKINLKTDNTKKYEFLNFKSFSDENEVSLLWSTGKYPYAIKYSEISNIQRI